MPGDPLAPFAPLLDALADRIVDRWLASTRTRMVAQTGSPLGPRKHIAAVKRRLRNGEGGAVHMEAQKRFLLTHDALQEELGLRPNGGEAATVTPPEPSPPDTDASAYARELLAKLQGLNQPKPSKPSKPGKNGGK
jgi:hypothetical protein